jgi:hypothetical protein
MGQLCSALGFVGWHYQHLRSLCADARSPPLFAARQAGIITDNFTLDMRVFHLLNSPIMAPPLGVKGKVV